ncbi:MAG: DUF3592 domain-containing protein [Clostridiales bacterium]|nr:DUF3592 domain-containing protein [Clostridiales bacterium]
MTEQESLLVISLFFILIGVIFAVVPIIMNKSRKKKAMKCDRETTATVVEYMCYRDDTTYTYAPVYSYWVNDKEYKKTSSYSCSIQKHSVGDKVALRYNSENPEMIFVEEEQYIIKFVSVIFGIISAVMLIVGFGIGIGTIIG